MVQNIKLSSGHNMPQVGFGLWKVDNPVAADTVYNAIKAGYRLFDGACGMLKPRAEMLCAAPFGVLSSSPRRGGVAAFANNDLSLPRPL